MRVVHYRRQHYFKTALCGESSDNLNKTNVTTTHRLTTCTRCLIRLYGLKAKELHEVKDRMRQFMRIEGGVK